MFCHSRAAGFVLGLTTAQMNRAHVFSTGRTDNQLRTYAHAGIFKNALPKDAADLPAYPNPAIPGAGLQERVKTYLEVNCAICHIADGGGNSRIELGPKTPLARAHLINEPPEHEDLGIRNPKLIAPGAPDRSVLYRRITRRGNKQMPPVSSNRVDEEGAALIRTWILSLAPK